MPQNFKPVLVVAKADTAPNKKPTGSVALNDVIEQTNGSAKTFTFYDFDLIRIAIAAERRLDWSDMPQADRVGFEVTATSSGPSAQSYKYASIGNTARMRRTAKGWMLVELDKDTVYPKAPERIVYRATDAQIAEMQRRAVDDIRPFPKPVAVAEAA